MAKCYELLRLTDFYQLWYAFIDKQKAKTEVLRACYDTQE